MQPAHTKGDKGAYAAPEALPPGLPISNRCEASTAPALDGSLIVVDKFQATISVVDLPTGELVGQVRVGHGPHELAVSADGSTAAVGNYGFTSLSNSISIVDLGTMTTTATYEFDRQRRPHDIWWLGDSLWITSEASNSVIEMDPETGRVLREFDVAEPAAHMMAPDLEAGRVFTANIIGGSVSRVDLSQDPPGEPMVVKIGGAGEGICLSPDRKEVWITDGQLHMVRVMDSETMEVTHEIACPGRPHRVRFSNDGARALVSCLDSNELAVIDVELREVVGRVANSEDAVIAIDESLLGTVQGTCLPSAIRLHPDGRHALLANINSNTVSVIDLETLEAVGVLRCGFGADGMAIVERRYGKFAG